MKKIISFVLTGILLCMLVGCGATKEESTTIGVGAMSGPTAMGMVKLKSDSDAGKTSNTYGFSELATDASALVTPIAKGDLDIAAVPSNLAATIYNNTDGGVRVIAACVLGVLNLVERGDSISSIADLKGQTIYATGQGAVPEYIIRYIFEKNDINYETDVDIVWCADTTEALSYVSSVDGAIAILPQPFVTAASAQVEDLRVVFDLNDIWNQTDAGCDIITGVIVANSEFADKYPKQLEKFIDEYTASVEFANTDIDATAELIAEYGIVPKAPLAKKALPGCHVVCITGNELKEALDGFLGILYNMNPKAVGGNIPDDNFYYGM